MDHYSLELLARQRQKELLEEGLHEAMVRRAGPASGQRSSSLRLIRILGAHLLVIIRQIALVLGL